MNIELLKLVVVVAIASSIIITALMQQIKKAFKFKNSKQIVRVSLIVSLIVGTLFAMYFSDLKLPYCIWSGLVSGIGAEGIYIALENKVFTPFGEMNNEDDIVIDRGDKNV